MTKEAKGIGFGFTAIAFFFFSNPNISIIDVFPDFLGYAFLCVGLSRLADLNESIGGAVSLFRKMILIDAGKWLSLLWVFGLSAPSERSSSLLLWSFVFAALEMIFLIPAYLKLFDGINQLGFFYPNHSIFVQGTKKKNATDRIKRITLCFISLKAVLSFLPELADLSNHVYDEGSEWINIYRYIGVIRMLAFLPVLIFGIVWIVLIERYFHKIRKDQTLRDALLIRYESDILPKKGLFVRRHFKLISAILLIALCFTVDFRLENHNMLPDFLVAIALLIGFSLLYKHFKLPAITWIPLGISYFLSSTLTFVLENRFFEKYSYSSIIKSDEARADYTVLILLNVLQSLLFLGLIILLAQALYRLIREHTGYVAGRETPSTTEEKMIHGVHADLRRSVLWSVVAAVLYVIFDVLYLILIPDFGFMNILQPIFAVVCIGTFARALTLIQQAMDTKYMLE